MAMMSTADKKRWRLRWWTINWKDGGRRRETTATRDRDERRQRQRIGQGDCGGLWRLPWTAMAADDGIEHRQHARAGGRQRWARDETGWQTKTAVGIYHGQ